MTSPLSLDDLLDMDDLLHSTGDQRNGQPVPTLSDDFLFSFLGGTDGEESFPQIQTQASASAATSLSPSTIAASSPETIISTGSPSQPIAFEAQICGDADLVTSSDGDFLTTDSVVVDLDMEDFDVDEGIGSGAGDQLVLTDEEKRLLSLEGTTLPTQLPLTKAEEKVLKKVRRKIKNKISAQESRKKKKDYVDGLEKRVENCTKMNRQLQKKVSTLENSNRSLMDQLRRLQGMLTSVRGPTSLQTGTCVMVLMLSFALLFIPGWNPFFQSNDAASEATYAPSSIRSRGLLVTDETGAGAFPTVATVEREPPSMLPATGVPSPAVEYNETKVENGEDDATAVAADAA